MTKPLVIFGGSGYIGRALCAYAIKQKIPVISISKHGKPKPIESWMNDPLITWVTCDIFNDDSWKSYIIDTSCCINLIGILFENKKKGLTYKKMIVQANELISTIAEKKKCPYIFLSAKGGPKGYISAKKQAENSLFTKTNPTIIIRSGLVVTKESPLRYSQGLLIKFASHVPFVNHFANKVYPTPLDKLVHTILNESKNPTSKLIEDIR